MTDVIVIRREGDPCERKVSGDGYVMSWNDAQLALMSRFPDEYKHLMSGIRSWRCDTGSVAGMLCITVKLHDESTIKFASDLMQRPKTLKGEEKAEAMFRSLGLIFNQLADRVCAK